MFTRDDMIGLRENTLTIAQGNIPSGRSPFYCVGSKSCGPTDSACSCMPYGKSLVNEAEGQGGGGGSQVDTDGSNITVVSIVSAAADSLLSDGVNIVLVLCIAITCLFLYTGILGLCCC